MTGEEQERYEEHIKRAKLHRSIAHNHEATGKLERAFDALELAAVNLDLARAILEGTADHEGGEEARHRLTAGTQ